MMQGIRFRILFAVLIPLLLLAVILGLFFVGARIDDARSDLEVQGQRFSQYLAAVSEFSLLAGDEQALQEIADTQLKPSGVLKALAFIDTTGMLLANSGRADEVGNLLDCYFNVGTCDQFDSRLFFNVPIFTSGVLVSENPELNPLEDNSLAEREFLGRMVFFYDTQPLAKLQQQLMINGLTITMAAALLVSTVSLIFANGLTRPIVRLSQVVNAIQQGQLSARTQPSGSGELLELENGVNAMAAKVEKANENLQQKVEQSTRELLNTLAQLKIKNRDLEEASKRVAEAGRVKDLFLAKMSHELRTPLSSIIGYLKLLEESNDSSQRKIYGKIVDQASGILLATIDDILDFIRLEDGLVRLENIEFNLRDCLENVVALQAPAAQKKQLQLDCQIDDSVPTRVAGDPARLAQIVTNLVSNAIKFTLQGYVRLQARTYVDAAQIAHLVIAVKDTGIGIAKDKQPLLFQPFVQAEDSISRKFGGSGLGLSIALRLAEAMHGDIQLHSDEGEGLEIIVTVQLQIVDRDSKIETLVLRPVAEIAVLVIDDDDLSRQLIRIQLEAQGAKVATAESGKSALEMAQAQQFELVLMDVHMPDLDGIALAPLLRQLLPQASLVALTANITGSEEHELVAAGVEKILYKPLHAQVINNLLHSSAASSQHPPGIAVTAEEMQSTLIVPQGIDIEEVITEFNRLCLFILESLEEHNWEALLDYAHKLLGSARLFTRGPFASLVHAMEEAAREQNRSATQQSLALVQADIESMVIASVSK